MNLAVCATAPVALKFVAQWIHQLCEYIITPCCLSGLLVVTELTHHDRQQLDHIKSQLGDVLNLQRKQQISRAT